MNGKRYEHPVPDFNILKLLGHFAQHPDAPAISSPVEPFSGSVDYCIGKTPTRAGCPVSVAAVGADEVLP